MGHISESVKKDEVEAMKYYEKAVERGNEIAKNILALKGKTFIPSMKKTLLNQQSNMSKILNNNNSQMVLEDNTGNSFFLNQSKINANRVKNPPLPLISSYISSGIPKQLIHKQMSFDSQMFNADGSDKFKGKFMGEENNRRISNQNSGRKAEKKTSMKENIPGNNNKIYEKFKNIS